MIRLLAGLAAAFLLATPADAAPPMWVVKDANSEMILFGSIHVLPPFWQKVTLFNPVVYLVSGFRWSFFGMADVSVAVSIGMTLLFLVICLAVVWWIFKTGYRLKS